MKRTPTLTFHYDETVEQGMRISRLLDEEDREQRGAGVATAGIEQVGGRAALARALPAHRPRGPRRRRARLAAGHAPPAHPARQGLGDVHGGEGVPAADRVPLPAPGGGLPRGPGGHGRPHGDLPRLRQHRPHAGRVPQRGRATSASTSTTTTTTPSSATSICSTPAPPARRRSSTGWRSRWGSRSRRRSPRRSTSA